MTSTCSFCSKWISETHYKADARCSTGNVLIVWILASIKLGRIFIRFKQELILSVHLNPVIPKYAHGPTDAKRTLGGGCIRFDETGLGDPAEFSHVAG